mmetsp:Transcript_6097/g.17818  ORF Transcript_6097/g.17818 Transcript_6097/m.17818 type:complete len:212 (-) Transcript_6097:144-779(-)
MDTRMPSTSTSRKEVPVTHDSRMPPSNDRRSIAATQNPSSINSSPSHLGGLPIAVVTTSPEGSTQECSTSSTGDTSKFHSSTSTTATLMYAAELAAAMSILVSRECPNRCQAPMGRHPTSRIPTCNSINRLRSSSNTTRNTSHTTVTMEATTLPKVVVQCNVPRSGSQHQGTPCTVCSSLVGQILRSPNSWPTGANNTSHITTNNTSLAWL